MVAPIPKTKANSLFNELAEIFSKSQKVSEFRLGKYLQEISNLKKTGVDLGILWMCEGYVYCLKKDTVKMHSAFQMSLKYDINFTIAKYNQATKYLANGSFAEAAEGFSHSIDDTAQDHLVKIAITTFNFDEIISLLTKKKHKEILIDKKEELIKKDFDISKLKKIMDYFYNLLKEKNLYFASIIQELDEYEYTIFIEANTDDVAITQSILSDFDRFTSTDEFFEASRKLVVILTPESRPWFGVSV